MMADKKFMKVNIIQNNRQCCEPARPTSICVCQLETHAKPKEFNVREYAYFCSGVTPTIRTMLGVAIFFMNTYLARRITLTMPLQPAAISSLLTLGTVSYTHLDVYKRQVLWYPAH